MNMSLLKQHPARIKKVLVYYDGPQLAILDDGSKYVVVAIATEIKGYQFPFFCAGVLPKTFEIYIKGKVDLRFIYKATPKSRYYICEMPANGEEFNLRKFGDKSDDLDSLLPAPGIFSNVHTHIFEDKPQGDFAQKFFIDGTWEARDFSKFYGRMADTYSLLYIVSGLDEAAPTQEDLDYLVTAIEEKPWKGGGSYLSFYKDLKEHAEAHPLRVESIEYHSPGNLVLAGKKNILQDMSRTISGIIENFGPKRALYTDLYRFMRRRGLLASIRSIRLGSRDSEIIIRRATALGESLELPNCQIILQACDKDAVRYAKVILSYFRRTRGLADFYVQGRVKEG